MVIWVKAGAAERALVDRYTPRLGKLLKTSKLRPLNPEPVETRILLSSAGSTRICVMERPVKISPAPLELNGPVTFGLALLALRMMNRPTPKKLSPELLASPVPTNTFV